MNFKIRTFLTLVGFCVMCTVARAQIIVDYASAPPATEGALFSKVVVVVRGRVQTRRMELPPGPQTSVYRVRIAELLKADGRHAVGEFINVHRHGGFESGNAEDSFPPFEINDELFLFLERGDNGWYWPLNGPDGAYKLNVDGYVHAYGLHDIAKRHHGRPVAQFLAEWRKYKK